MAAQSVGTFRQLTIHLRGPGGYSSTSRSERLKLVLKKRTPASTLGAIRDITVDNVIARVRGTSTIVGHLERPIENLRLTNINLTMLPENAPDKRADDALFIESARGVRVRDLSMRWDEEETEPKWRSALVLRKISDFDVNGFKGRQGLPRSTAAPILVEDVDRGVIRNSEATEGSRRLVHVGGGAASDVTVNDSRVPSGAAVATFERSGLDSPLALPLPEIEPPRRMPLDHRPLRTQELQFPLLID